MQKRAKTDCLLLQLPDPLLFNVFSHLDLQDLFSLSLTSKHFFNKFSSWRVSLPLARQLSCPLSENHVISSCPICHPLLPKLSLCSCAPLFSNHHFTHLPISHIPLSHSSSITASYANDSHSFLIATTTSFREIIMYSSIGTSLSSSSITFSPLSLFITTSSSPLIVVSGTKSNLWVMRTESTMKHTSLQSSPAPITHFEPFYDGFIGTFEYGFVYNSKGSRRNHKVVTFPEFKNEVFIENQKKSRLISKKIDNGVSIFKSSSNSVYSAFVKGFAATNLSGSEPISSTITFLDENVTDVIGFFNLSHSDLFLVVTDVSILLIDSNQSKVINSYNHLQFSWSKITAAALWSFGHGLLICATSNEMLLIFEILPTITKKYEQSSKFQITKISHFNGIFAFSGQFLGLISIFDLYKAMQSVGFELVESIKFLERKE
ncbi:hypothetical protein GEMRC1_009413 [Eukaryota sp. GEM-RC1]